MCKAQNPVWFTAAAQGDLAYLQQNMRRYFRLIDRRESQEPEVFNGFGAIHYAAFSGKVEAVRLLLQAEGDLETGATVLFNAPGFSKCTKYKLAAGSSPLAIALLRGHSDVCRCLIDFLNDSETARQEILGKLNQMGLTTYIVASICKIPEAMEILLNEYFLKQEFHRVLDGDVTPLFNAVYFGRINTMKALIRLAGREDTQTSVFKMCLGRDNTGKNALELAVMDVDLVKFDCTKAEREEIQAMAYDLVKSAFLFARGSNDEKWVTAIQTFLAGKDPLDIFGEVL